MLLQPAAGVEINHTPNTPPFLSQQELFLNHNGYLGHMGALCTPPHHHHTHNSVPTHLSLQMWGTRATRAMSLISEAQCCPCLVQQPSTASLVIHDHKTGPCNTIGFVCDPVWGNDMHAICMRSQIKLLCIYTDTWQVLRGRVSLPHQAKRIHR